MAAWALHWLWDDFGLLVWPNVAATPFCAALSAAWTLRRVRVHLRRHHEAIRAEIAKRPPPG